MSCAIISAREMTNHTEYLADFRSRHSNWLDARLAENEVVYCLSEDVLAFLRRWLELTEREVAAEWELIELCRRPTAVGITRDTVIEYRWLHPRPQRIGDERLQSMRELGWSEEHIRQTRRAVAQVDDIDERIQGAAGRLICRPAFLEERDRLRSIWNRLSEDERPGLPLWRSAQVSQLPDGHDRGKVSRRLKDFKRDFDAFCDTWRLQGMATWDLPNPHGPKWPDPLPQPGKTRTGALSLDTPWHFPVLEADGLGPMLRETHKEEAAEHGVDDPLSWQTYAKLLELDHWQRVMQERYQSQHRPRGFVREMEWKLAELLHLELERLHKLRGILAKLKRGEQSSLARRRH